jgi:hypothetical protein
MEALQTDCGDLVLLLAFKKKGLILSNLSKDNLARENGESSIMA